MNLNYEMFKHKVLDIIDLDLNSYKEQQMHRRILQWISRYNLENFSGLITKLKDEPEHRQKFIDYLTINTSHFFRDQVVFSHIESSLLPKIAGSTTRIWSAGCSIGAEVYSIVMLLLDYGHRFKYILASDIDEDSLLKAHIGVYHDNQVNQIPQKLLDKYFVKRDENYILKDVVKKHVKFKKHNLLTDPYESNFDLILCRNVFIYFTPEIQHNLINRFVKSLKPKGYFIVGSAEHIINPDQYGLDRVSYCVYQKR